MIDMILAIELKECRWSSDWNGYEVGYPNSPVVGYYTWRNPVDDEVYGFYIDIEKMVILEFWQEPSEEE